MDCACGNKRLESADHGPKACVIIYSRQGKLTPFGEVQKALWRFGAFVNGILACPGEDR